MTVNEVRQQGWLIFETISGSRAYGLETSDSDTDIKGVFVLPREQFYRMEDLPQVSNPSHDIVYYELRRFIELLSANNPNLLEMLFVGRECILHQDPLFEEIKPQLFLSRLCRDTFAGYAYSQLKKAGGLKKKILNPLEREKKSLLDFCYAIEQGRSSPLASWLAEKGFSAAACGLVSIPHAPQLYALYHDPDADPALNTRVNPGNVSQSTLGFKGILRQPDSQDVLLSSVPKGLKPVALLSVNKDGYSQYCREYQQYWEWVAKRNPVRYAGTMAHGKPYDSKNMMHTFRLLDIASEIARTGRFTTRRPNREELLAIRAGEYSYLALMQRADRQMSELEELFASSALPARPDRELINRLLVRLRLEYYTRDTPG